MAKGLLIFVKVAKFRQIWSHCSSLALCFDFKLKAEAIFELKRQGQHFLKYVAKNKFSPFFNFLWDQYCKTFYRNIKVN